MQQTKSCSKCKQTKPLSDFSPEKKGYKLGVSSRCHTCKNEATADWRKRKLSENPNYYKEKYWQDPERHRQRTRQHRNKHRKRINTHNRNRYRNDITYLKAQKRSHTKWYSKARDTLRINRWLYGYTIQHRSSNGRRPISGYLKTQGICLFCGELNPFLLQNAHVFKNDHDLLISLCCNCHYLLDHYPMALEI